MYVFIVDLKGILLSCKLNFTCVSALFFGVCLHFDCFFFVLHYFLLSVCTFFTFFKLHFPLDVIFDANNYRNKGRPIAGVAKVLCQRGGGGGSEQLKSEGKANKIKKAERKKK